MAEGVLTLRSQFSFTRMLLGFYGTNMRGETEPTLHAYEIAMDDAGRVHIFKPTLKNRDKGRKPTGKGRTDQNLVQKVLDKLLFQRS